MRLGCWLIIVVFHSTLWVGRIGAISFGQIDTFQDGTTMNWQEGLNSPNPPTNISTGGPAGAGDKYLQDTSSGGFGAGSKLIMFNESQWIGNYNVVGVDRITAQMANLGSTTVSMRIGIRSTSGTVYGSTTAAQLSPDGVWRTVTFDLTPSALTNIGGADSVSQVLSSVAEIRILSAVGGPSFTGDPIAATLGIDNITGRDIANFIFRITRLDFPGGAPRVAFTTVSGRSYRVERKNSLLDSNWTPVNNGATVAGNSGVIQVTDNEPGAGSQAHGFYRAVLLPP